MFRQRTGANSSAWPVELAGKLNMFVFTTNPAAAFVRLLFDITPEITIIILISMERLRTPRNGLAYHGTV